MVGVIGSDAGQGDDEQAGPLVRVHAVGRDGATAAQIARELRVGNNTVMRAVRKHGTPMAGAAAKLEGVSAVGVHEHVWGHTCLYSKTNFATGSSTS